MFWQGNIVIPPLPPAKHPLKIEDLCKWVSHWAKPQRLGMPNSSCNLKLFFLFKSGKNLWYHLGRVSISVEKKVKFLTEILGWPKHFGPFYSLMHFITSSWIGGEKKRFWHFVFLFQLKIMSTKLGSKLNLLIDAGVCWIQIDTWTGWSPKLFQFHSGYQPTHPLKHHFYQFC